MLHTVIVVSGVGSRWKDHIHSLMLMPFHTLGLLSVVMCSQFAGQDPRAIGGFGQAMRVDHHRHHEIDLLQYLLGTRGILGDSKQKKKLTCCQ